MRVPALLLAAMILASCGHPVAPAARPRPVAPAAARAAADDAATALAKGALGAYPKHLDAVLKAIAAKDQKAFTAAFEKLLKSLADALRDVAKAMRAGTQSPTADAVDRALADVDAMRATYDALPGDLAFAGGGEKERLVVAMERTLMAALLEVATPPAPGGD